MGVPLDNVGIVLEDTVQLAELCGANDYNLGVMGSLLGTPVYTRGNELYVDTDDQRVRTLFPSLVAAVTTASAAMIFPTG